MAAKRKRATQRPASDFRAVDRAMLRDDVSWLGSLIFSSRATPWGSVLGIVLAPQIARVVHESLELARRNSPASAAKVAHRLEADTAAARHAIKLVDDTARTVDDVLADFARVASDHSDRFPLGADVSVPVWRGEPLATSRMAEYFGIASIHRKDMQEFASDMSSAMMKIALDVVGIDAPQWVTLELPCDDVVWLDVISSEVYPSLYGGVLSEAEVDLLLSAEGLMRSALLYAELSEQAFPGPVFRAQVLAVVHAASAAAEVASRRKEQVPSTVRQVLDSDPVKWFREHRGLRNRAMHYGIPGHLTGVDASEPMYGLVEAVSGRAYEDVRAELARALTRFADVLGRWRGEVDGVPMA